MPTQGQVQMGDADDPSISADFQLSVLSPRVQEITATAGGLKVKMPPAADLKPGGPHFYICNVGAEDFDITENDDTVIVTAAQGTCYAIGAGPDGTPFLIRSGGRNVQPTGAMIYWGGHVNLGVDGSPFDFVDFELVPKWQNYDGNIFNGIDIIGWTDNQLTLQSAGLTGYPVLQLFSSTGIESGDVIDSILDQSGVNSDVSAAFVNTAGNQFVLRITEINFFHPAIAVRFTWKGVKGIVFIIEEAEE